MFGEDSKIARKMEASLSWMVGFCEKHAEWFGEGVPDYGAKLEWLVAAKQVLDEVKSQSDLEEKIGKVRQLKSSDCWAEDATFPREAWRSEAGEGDTQLGYWDWVEAQVESAHCEESEEEERRAWQVEDDGE